MSVYGSGAIVSFTDGSKWTRSSSEITVEIRPGYFKYRAVMRVSPSDIQIFSTRKIKKVRLNIFDGHIEEDYAEQFRKFVDCIKIAK